jgi:hypothetical protein
VFQAAIYKEVGGVFTQIAASTIASGTGTLRLELFGPSIKLFFNNVLVTYGQDTTFSSGGIGMRASSGASLDNFVASAITATNATLSFSDTFNAAVNQQLSTSWTEQAGNFQVTGGFATGQGALNLAIVNGISSANVTLAEQLSLPLNSFGGIVARYTGPGNNTMYIGQLDRLGDGTYQARIFKVISGVSTQIGSTATILASGGALQFTLNGASLTLSVDATPVVIATDSSISAAGSVGMRVGTGVAVDSFSAN